MDEDDDLAKELAQFERQIEQVAAATKAKQTLPETPVTASIHQNGRYSTAHHPRVSPTSSRPSDSTPLPVSVSLPLTAHPIPRSTSSHSPSIKPRQASTPPTDTTAKAETPVAKPTHRWFWNAQSWQWLPCDSIPRRKQASALPTHIPLMNASPSTASASTSAAASTSTSALTSTVSPSVKGPTDTALKNTARSTVSKRTAAGAVWQDATLQEWPEDDHRLFVGDLGPDATDDDLKAAFAKYSSFNMARVVKDKHTSACRGYGFVSFASAHDMLSAVKEMNGKYVGSRPIKLRKSNWQKRSLSKEKWKQVRAFRTISKR